MRAAVFALALLAHASIAAAVEDDERPSPFEERPTAMFLHAGIGAPLGFGGVEVEHAVLPVWTLSSGVGLGAASLQAAAMTRLRLGGDWSRAEIGATHRWPSGFSMRYFVGYGRVVAGDFSCEEPAVDACLANHPNDGRELLYTGFGVGGSF